MKTQPKSFGIQKMLRSLVFMGVALTLGAAAQAPTDLRIALVIGNAAYPGRLALTNPANDATAMSAALRNMGFTVIEAKDASRAQMEDAIKQMFMRLKGKQGIGMLYYAGHGLQVDWKNYMVPVDAKLQSSKDVPTQTVDVGDVIEALKAAGSRMNVIVLDACRDNPFAEKGVKGLAPVDAPVGTFLAYATSPGNVAEDGTGSNGLYTKHLLAELQKPVSIENVFKRVRLNVRKESEGRQIPWESTSLEEEFSFATNKPVVVANKAAQREADFAEQKSAWDKIKDSSNANDFYDFLSKYPSGLIAEIAQVRLEKLNPINKQSGLTQDALKASDFQVLRKLKVGDAWKSSYTIYQKDMKSVGRQFDILHVVEKQVGENLLLKESPQGFLMPSRTSIITPEGALVSVKQFMTTDTEYSPPAAQLPAERLQVGYKSTARVAFNSSGTSKEIADFDMKVTKKEKVKVPYGEYETYLVERLESSKGDLFTNSTYLIRTNAWYRGDLRIPIKSEIFWSTNGRAVDELISVDIKDN